ncbi:hypothetical protein [Bacillus ndiopicus]|uniref:hypothetical protein n=1 Tax=Bacillus ndiopicus TaxID=1347368 RepID=UPI0005A8280D|nr:hypothetical protein [Bacillus ndiopicus]
MAQLVKIQDYISRYEIDFARYPTQFVRLKKVQWERIKYQWETGGELNQQWEHVDTTDDIVEAEKPKLSFLKKLFPLKKQAQPIEELVSTDEVEDEGIMDEDTTLLFEPNIVYNPQTLEELKRMFMDQFFHFQMKWASSTLREKSYVDPKYMRDTLLRTLLLDLPDNYLLFYYPILRVKKAPIELEVIVMTPVECICITVVEEENQAVYIGGSERFWVKKVGKQEKKTLNPFIRLNRMETLVKQLFEQANVEMPVRKVLLSRNGYFDYPGSAYGVQFIDKRNYPEWLQQMRRTVSPMKHMQIRAAQSILAISQTTSFHRDIWSEQKKDDE